MQPNQPCLSPERSHPVIGAGSLEEEGYSSGYRCIAGLDEVGRGPLAGPVVAAAVVFPREFLVSGFGLRVNSKLKTRNSILEIKDSKLLNHKKREVLAAWIKGHSIAWGVGVVGSEEIDRINILRATFLAMTHAVRQLRPSPDYLLIDGPHNIPVAFFPGREGSIEKPESSSQKAVLLNKDSSALTLEFSAPAQKAVKRGDQLCLSIAAASIVAKVTRDRMMVEYDRLYPEYGFAQHKGYGSSSHLAALGRYGPSPLHRRSFRPVRECTGLAISDQQSAFSFDPTLADR